MIYTKNNKEKLKSLTISEFSQKASLYDSDGMFEMVKEDYSEVIEEVMNEPFNSLVDYGCGTGELLNRLYKRDPVKDYIGVDITPEIIEVAKEKNKDISYYVGDSESFLLPEGSVDVITCVHSFHHYPSPELFLSNAKKSLKKGGRLIIRDNSSKSFIKYIWMNYVRYPISHIRGKGDVHFYSVKEISRLSENEGLYPELIEIRHGNKLHCVFRKVK